MPESPFPQSFQSGLREEAHNPETLEWALLCFFIAVFGFSNPQVAIDVRWPFEEVDLM